MPPPRLQGLALSKPERFLVIAFSYIYFAPYIWDKAKGIYHLILARRDNQRRRNELHEIRQQAEELRRKIEAARARQHAHLACLNDSNEEEEDSSSESEQEGGVVEQEGQSRVAAG